MSNETPAGGARCTCGAEYVKIPTCKGWGFTTTCVTAFDAAVAARMPAPVQSGMSEEDAKWLATTEAMCANAEIELPVPVPDSKAAELVRVVFLALYRETARACRLLRASEARCAAMAEAKAAGK